MTASKIAASHKSAPAPVVRDAITLLKADHEAMRHLFADYETARSVADKTALVAEICTALSVHAQIEEEIFYPAVTAALKDEPLAPEARAAQVDVKGLIAQLKRAEPGGEICDARVKLLSDYVKRHVKEEQAGMFHKARASSLDMVKLGVRMAARKHRLLAHAA
jgi:hypothetical protein